MASLNGDRLPWAAGIPSPLGLAFPLVSDPRRLEPTFTLVLSGPKLTSKPGALEQTGSHVPSCSRVTPSTSLTWCCQVRTSSKHEATNASETLVELDKATLGKDLHLSPCGLSQGLGHVHGVGQWWQRQRGCAGAAVGLCIPFVPVQIPQQVMDERH